MPLRIYDHINRVYRFSGQSVTWLISGLTGFVVCFLVLPLTLLLVRKPEQRQILARKIIRACFSAFVWTTCKMRLMSCEVSGLENYDENSSQLILANHPTFIDVVILISLFPQVDCVIKEAVTRNPFFGAAVKAANYISNREPTDLLQSCVERLQSGATLLLFPEGTRSVSGRALEFKAGAAEIALRADADILPVVIDCRPQFLAKGEPWYYIAPRKPAVEVRVLPPIRSRSLVDSDNGIRQARHALNDALTLLFETELS